MHTPRRTVRPRLADPTAAATLDQFARNWLAEADAAPYFLSFTSASDSCFARSSAAEKAFLRS